jgi:hypothetical protein
MRSKIVISCHKESLDAAFLSIHHEDAMDGLLFSELNLFNAILRRLGKVIVEKVDLY